MTPEAFAEAQRMRKYFVEWSMKHHPEGMTGAELEERGDLFGSESLLAASIARPADGSYSVFFHSMDGKTGKELSDQEWFKVFLMLSKRLGDSKTLDEGRKELARMPFEMMKELMGLGPDCGHPGCAAGKRHED